MSADLTLAFSQLTLAFSQLTLAFSRLTVAFSRLTVAFSRSLLMGRVLVTGPGQVELSAVGWQTLIALLAGRALRLLRIPGAEFDSVRVSPC